MAERIDDLNRNGYKIIQADGHFKFGCDAVLLSGFAKVKKDERVLDLGCGTGIIPILLAAKTKGAHFTGLEIQSSLAEMAERSVELNGLTDKIEIHAGDIREIRDIFPASAFDVVTSNPPYMLRGSGHENKLTPMAIARHEITLSLSELAKAAAWALKFGGRFYMVHRPERLPEIMNTLTENKLEPKMLRFVQPFIDNEPDMVLTEAVLGAKPGLRVKPALVMYKEPGVFTDEVFRIYYG